MGGLVLIAVLGTAVDIIALIPIISKGSWGAKILVVLHLAYSIILMALAGPILKIHIGLVSRNELASEWKRNDFYVIKRGKHGESIPVNELSDDEFNARFDTFEYERRRNIFDHGCTSGGEFTEVTYTEDGTNQGVKRGRVTKGLRMGKKADPPKELAGLLPFVRSIASAKKFSRNDVHPLRQMTLQGRPGCEVGLNNK